MRSIRFCHISITSPTGKCQPPTVFRVEPLLPSRAILFYKKEQHLSILVGADDRAAPLFLPFYNKIIA